MALCYRVFAPGYRLLAPGYRLLAPGCRMLALAGLMATVPIILPTSAADLVERFEGGEATTDDVFAGRLLLGVEGPWKGMIEEGAYFLINQDAPDAVKTVVLRPAATGSPPQEQTIAVDVYGQLEGNRAGAGVLYGYDPESEEGYAFVVRPSGGYAVYGLAKGVADVVTEGTNAAVRPAAFNRLAVRIDGENATLMVNDEQVYAHQATDERPLAGEVGIVAVDVGAYSFDNLSVARP